MQIKIIILIFVKSKKQFDMKKSLKKHTLLVGEGVNQHTLYGDFAMDLAVVCGVTNTKP